MSGDRFRELDVVRLIRDVTDGGETWPVGTTGTIVTLMAHVEVVNEDGSTAGLFWAYDDDVELLGEEEW